MIIKKPTQNEKRKERYKVPKQQKRANTQIHINLNSDLIIKTNNERHNNKYNGL